MVLLHANLDHLDHFQSLRACHSSTLRCILYNIKVSSIITQLTSLAEVNGVTRTLNGLSVDAVYPILVLYPLETPVPSLSCRFLLLGCLLCSLACCVGFPFLATFYHFCGNPIVLGRHPFKLLLFVNVIVL